MGEWAGNLKRRFAGGDLCSFEPVDAILWKLDLANFHKDEATTTLTESPHLLTGTNVLQSEEDQYNCALLKLEANVIGVAHSLHSLNDLFAQLVNFCLLKKLIPESNVRAGNVCANLREKGAAGAVIAKFKQIKESKEFQYLNGLTNSVKHRGAIRGTRMYIGLQGAKSLEFTGCFLQQFEYANTQHPYKGVELFLTNDFATLLEHFEDLGEIIAKEAGES